MCMCLSVCKMEADSVNEVCEFLKNRLCAPPSVLEKFENEKMTFVATAYASDADLIQLGITSNGDRISLRKYCSNKLEEIESKESLCKKKNLLEKIISDNKAKKKRETSSGLPLKKRKVQAAGSNGTRKVQVGWLHYDEKQGRYISVRLKKGGGTRDIDMPLAATADEIIEIGKDIFFNPDNDKELAFGPAEIMEFSVANFKEQLVTAVFVAGIEFPFTLQRYINSTRLHKLRLYLASRVKRSTEEKDVNHHQQKVSPENSKTRKPEQDRMVIHEELLADQYSDDILMQPVFNIQDTRKAKPEDCAMAFHEHLARDKEDEMVKHPVINLEDNRVLTSEEETLQLTRLERVPNEPKQGTGSVHIQVRHVTLGNIGRTFSPSDKMLSVYDWVGSKCPLPMHFELSDFRGQVVVPAQSVMDGDRCTLSMSPSATTPSLEQDGQVDFKGFGNAAENNHNNTLPLHKPPPVESCLPEQMFAEENSLAASDEDEIQEKEITEGGTSNEGVQHSSTLSVNSHQQDLTGSVNGEELEDIPTGNTNSMLRTTQGRNRDNGANLSPGFMFRQFILPALLGETAQEVVVHRACIKQDMISIFKREVNGTLSFKMVDSEGRKEQGEGQGVARDVICTFWQQLFSSATVGDTEKVPSIRHDYQKSTWEAIGRILVYGYERLGYFPLAISRAFIASCLFGEESIDSAFLLSSFRNYITNDEREILDSISQGDFDSDDPDILEFLGNYKCYKKPKKETVQAIVLELAHQEIVQRPRYIAECWMGMMSGLKAKEPFKSVENLTAFYAAKRPTAKKVLSALQAAPSNDAERQSFDFLRKFIRSLDAKALETFLKYTTGSTMLTDAGLSVSFTTLDGLARRPIAHTCGPLLEIPCTFQSYSELAEEFTSILSEKGAWGFNIV